MDTLKYFDFFSIKFSFYTNRQPKHQNIFGGIMSLIYFLTCIGIFISFSLDDLCQLNPITSISEVPDAKTNVVNMHKEKIWIPFRILTNGNNFIDHRGTINIIAYYVEGKNNEKFGMKLNHHVLNYKLCNETSMINSTDIFKIKVPLNELFCIENDDVLFGGSWNDDFINYLEINLYLCNDDIYFNESNPRCTKISELLKNINTYNTLSFDFYYPVIQFQPTNLKIPISIIYKNYIYQLSTYSYKIEKLYIQEHILSDDKNFIYTDYKNSSCWGISSLYGDDYLFSNQLDPIMKKNPSKIFTMEIFMDDGLVFYTRTYKKIISIISNVFPIFRFILYFFNFITKHIKMSKTKRKLAGFIFENIEKTPKKLFEKKIKESDKNLNQQNNKIIIESNKSKENLINNIVNKNNLLQDNNNIKINNELKENDNNNKSDAFLNDENAIKNLNRNEILLMNKKRKSIEIVEPSKIITLPKKKDKLKNKKPKYLFPYYYFFLDILFDKLIYPKKFFCLSKTYFTVYNFMSQIYDISTYIILFKQFNMLNKIIMDKMHEDEGFCPSKPYNKINIGNEKIVEKLNKDLGNKKSLLFSNNLIL